MARVRIGDVAREAGVSLGTVSNALNHPERVRADTRQLIYDAVERLGYLPNQSARLLAGGENQIIGLVLPRFNHGCSLQIANGARNEAERAGFDLIIMSADDNEDTERRYLRFCIGMQLAGVMVQPGSYEMPELSHALPVPVVYLSVPDVPEYRLSVSADYTAQGRLIAEHLIKQGAEHVAVIGEASAAPLKQRLEGVRAVAAKRPDVEFEVINEGSRHGSIDGARLGSQLARRDAVRRPDAILALVDTLAAGAVAGAQGAGLAIPDDMMVAGCDGNPLAWGGSVQLTTCSPAGYEIGRKGVQMLVEQISREREGEHEAPAGLPRARAPRAADHVLVRPFLMARASTLGERVGRVPGFAGVATEPAPQELDLGLYL